MTTRERSYRYVGPADLKAAVRPGSGGRRIGSAADFAHWIAERTAPELVEPFTFVSAPTACSGWPLAGEISFTRKAGRWVVDHRCRRILTECQRSLTTGG
ncbi:hypothetical protein ACFY2N_14530 [Streptomyces rubiginosohelvolus]|uniref:hypothetical protein n=1 Tax=Streptomyces rubiginosohelvolus TaxID=67362 RepID=UPI00369A52E9